VLSLLAATILSLCFHACSDSPRPNAADGERWYSLHRCNGCHGEGGSDGKAAELAGTDLGFRSFLAIVRSPESPSMPAYPPEKLSSQDTADIHLWLQSIQQ